MSATAAEPRTDGADDLVRVTLQPLVGVGPRFMALVFGLLSIIGFGVYAYATQLRQGLAVTGMAETADKIIWGLYIVNFVFFIGISHAGTLISAILRTTKARWRVAITRMAEFITVVALLVGALFPIFDLGRPDRILNLFAFGRWQSPILWDLLSITTYLAGSLIYLYLPLIPDLALCRDRLSGQVSPLKRTFYRVLAVGWRDDPEQRRSLGRALTVMMVLIIPVAISVHTVVSWIFGMTLRTGWNSTMYGAYFVTGAIFSGTATLVIVMALLRKVFGLHSHLRERHFVNLGYLMATLSLIMIYFNLSEYVTTSFKLEGEEVFFLSQIFTGAFAGFFWVYLIGGLAVPGLLMLMPWTRNFWGVLVAAVLVDVAMWLERYMIVVGTLRVPQMPYPTPADYLPTWPELAITAAAFALFGLVIAMFTKLVPVLAIWEVREQLEEPAPTLAVGAPQAAAERA